MLVVGGPVVPVVLVVGGPVVPVVLVVGGPVVVVEVVVVEVVVVVMLELVPQTVRAAGLCDGVPDISNAVSRPEPSMSPRRIRLLNGSVHQSLSFSRCKSITVHVR